MPHSRETLATVSETELAEGGTVLGRFGVPGLTLAVVGICGVIAYSVSLREREIGIRLAPGADRGAVLGEGLWLAVTDTVIGMAAVLGYLPRVRTLESD